MKISKSFKRLDFLANLVYNRFLSFLSGHNSECANLNQTYLECYLELNLVCSESVQISRASNSKFNFPKSGRNRPKHRTDCEREQRETRNNGPRRATVPENQSEQWRIHGNLARKSLCITRSRLRKLPSSSG